MCNSYGVTVSWIDYLDGLAAQGLRLSAPDGVPNLEPTESLWPTDRAPILRPGGAPREVELVQMRWGFRPPHAKAGPIINLRSEGRRFTRGRCLVPASWFFEFTGTRSPKSKWRFTRTGEDWFCFAGLWRRCQTPDGAPVDAFTLLTCEPGPDVAPIHNRQPVILEPSQWGAWLDSRSPSTPLINPSPAGSLTVEKAS